MRVSVTCSRSFECYKDTVYKCIPVNFCQRIIYQDSLLCQSSLSHANILMRHQWKKLYSFAQISFLIHATPFLLHRLFLKFASPFISSISLQKFVISSFLPLTQAFFFFHIIPHNSKEINSKIVT